MGIFDWLFKKKAATPAPAVTASVRTQWVECDPIGNLSHLNFGNPAGKYEAPTERQLNYLKDLGVVIPDGITKDDASCMISRATGEDSIEVPSPSLVALALGLKTHFSAFIGANGLLRTIIWQASERDRAALYAYGVRQSIRGGSFGNMLDDPALSVFYGFADKVLNDAALLRSLSGRDPRDYKRPNRGTSIYKAAAAYLTACGVQ